MKHIVAFVRPAVIPALVQSLLELPGFPGMSVVDCEGFGREKAESGNDYSRFFHKKRLEIFAPDALVETIIGHIVRIAHSGHPGDGKVYLTEVDEGLRLSTLERGPHIA